jgi:hypothetical protein
MGKVGFEHGKTCGESDARNVGSRSQEDSSRPAGKMGEVESWQKVIWESWRLVLSIGVLSQHCVVPETGEPRLI